MKTERKPYGVKIWNIVPCSSGFGEWESNGATFVRKDSLKPKPELDGLIRNQTGKAVQAETHDGSEVVGMLTNWDWEAQLVGQTRSEKITIR